MRKLAVLAVLIVSVIFWSCNRSPKNEGEKNDIIPETSVLDSKDAMMAKLAEYKIVIPEDMIFRSVDKQVDLNKDFEEVDTYLVYFDSENLNDVLKEELLKWYDDQRKVLKDDGWKEQSYEQDIEIMGGGSYRQAILVKESENCTLDIRLGFMDNSSSISIHPKYEIE